MRNQNPSQFDVIVIGGGPAGMSASLWCAELGLSSILIEKEPELGGQLLWTFNAINNYLGVHAANGLELRNQFKWHLEGHKIRHETDSKITTTSLTDKTVILEDGARFYGRAVVIATGVRRRTLGIPGEREFRGSGILYSGFKARDAVKGKKVLIVGGGDAALENALILSETAEKVYLIHRRSRFSAREEFIDRIERSPMIQILFEHVVTDIQGSGKVETVGVQHTSTQERRGIEIDNVLIRIGVLPNTELFRGQVELDDRGFIHVDAVGATSLENTFAAGDITSPNILNISNAVGRGAAVAKAIYSKLMR